MSPDVDWRDPDNRLTMMAATLDIAFDPDVGYPNADGEQHYEVFRSAVLGKRMEVFYLDGGGFMSHVTGIGPSPDAAQPNAVQPSQADPTRREMRFVW